MIANVLWISLFKRIIPDKVIILNLIYTIIWCENRMQHSLQRVRACIFCISYFCDSALKIFRSGFLFCIPVFQEKHAGVGA